MTTLYPNCFKNSTQHDSSLFSYQSYMLCIQNNQLCFRAVQCFWSSRWGALIRDSHYEDGAINPSDFLIPLCGFFPLYDWEWLIATSLNGSGEAACLSVMLVLLLFLSGGEWWACTSIAYPKSGCRDREWCGAAVPSQEIGLGQPWHRRAVGRDAAFVVGLLVLREPKVLLGLFYCVLLCSPGMLSFGKQECSETAGAAGWEENPISNWFEWE